ARAGVPRLAQIVLNLILNAVEAMRSSDAKENELRVRLGTTDTGRVLIEVEDTGPGIPAENLQRIFEPFYTTKPAGKGTGLGLAITHRLVHELDGEISVASTLGDGATSRVTLRAASSLDEPASPGGRRADAQHGE